jgi:hypothetical protein
MDRDWSSDVCSSDLGKTMQQNYIDPRLMEQMYYRGLLSR